MSNKRMFGLALFGLLFIAAVVGVMLFFPSFRDDSRAISLPPEPHALERPNETQPDALDRVEVTKNTVQNVIFTLSRPRSYSRDIRVEKFWQGGEAQYDILFSAAYGVSSIRIQTQDLPDKRIIVTSDEYYIWYSGETAAFAGKTDGIGGADRLADEMQMIITYEDILGLEVRDISDAGFTEFNGENCIFVEYLSPLFRYLTKYYVSIDYGLLLGVEEYDETGMLTYRMTASETIIDEVDPAAFTLPNGTVMIDIPDILA